MTSTETDLSRHDQAAWKLPGTLILLTLVTLVGLYWQTADSMVAIWIRSETFAHGFLILPITLWLIWQKRHQLLATRPRPFLLGVLPLLLFGFLWIAADQVDVLVGTQLALVAMINLATLILVGPRVYSLIAFPMLFLFFAVPIGERLIPPMIEFTADFTVGALELTGIPVYREGNFFSIPSGNWSVVEACSGVRYLIASVTLGFLYAYLTFRSLWRRLLFIAFSIIVPIIANGLRAYLIVMLAHLSNNKLAVGVDHLIYGWVFFGLVMMLLFWVGSFWREDLDPQPPIKRSKSGETTSSLPIWSAAVVMAVASAAIWPTTATLMEGARYVEVEPLNLPQVAGWEACPNEELTTWYPYFDGMDDELRVTYQQGEARVGLYLAFYADQEQGNELIQSTHTLIDPNQELWRRTGYTRRDLAVEELRWQAEESRLATWNQKLLVRNWYWVDGDFVTNSIIGKLLEARANLLGRAPSGAVLVVYAPYEFDAKEAAEPIDRFTQSAIGPLRRILSAAQVEATAAGSR